MSISNSGVDISDVVIRLWRQMTDDTVTRAHHEEVGRLEFTIPLRLMLIRVCLFTLQVREL